MLSNNYADHNDIENELERFVVAQKEGYAGIIKELQDGNKRTHWMWFVFPQIAGLGTSTTAKFYAINNSAEAREYLDHPILGLRLRNCCAIILKIEGRTADEIFGFPDNAKLQSCMTLFSIIAPTETVFDLVLAKYYNNQKDRKTIEILNTGL